MPRFPVPYWCVAIGAAVIIAASVTWHFSGGNAPTRTGTSETSSMVAGANTAQQAGDGVAALRAPAALGESASSTARKEMTAHAYLVASLAGNAAPTAIKNSSDRWPLASLTKLMTARIVLHRMSPSELITIIDVPGAYAPSGKRMPAGEVYRADDLLRVMLVESSNEAAESFAAAYGRSEFVTAMNDQAAAWKLADTHFDDPAGLSAASQSTAADLLTLARHIYAEDPQIFQITQLRSFTAPTVQGTSSYNAVTTNEFAGGVTFLGGKTGYTDEAHGNLVSLFSVRGAPTAFIVLGSLDRFGDTRALLKQTSNTIP